MTDWRLEAFRAWEQMIEPEWANVSYNLIFRLFYYSAPKAVDPNKTLDDVDPELLEMYKKVRYPRCKMMNNSHGYRSRFGFCCNYFQNISEKELFYEYFRS
jgi:Fe-S cluster assembly protein SufB